ncbi:hypothetical protein GF336_05835 [Candidatus Woesearchaeota archaeon]|nr:hypothetical protein [Candidatus Woesearchaeota archaeon]
MKTIYLNKFLILRFIMKHTPKITLILFAIFLLSQFVGLSIVKEYLDFGKTAETGEPVYDELPYDVERPPVRGMDAVITIIAAILVGTVIALLIIKFNKLLLWKLWFLVAVFLTLTVAFNAFLPQLIALVVALILALFKIFRPGIITQNITEIFMYGGLAAIFVPILDHIIWGFLILAAISIYDMIAVWKIKHMISLAKFQTNSKIFAGLLIPYEIPKLKKPKGKTRMKKVKSAILGGGDIGFPLIFAGIVMHDLALSNPEWLAFLKTLIIPVCVAVALLFLLLKSKKDKFYPAMPFLSAGCILGYLLVLLVNIFV